MAQSHATLSAPLAVLINLNIIFGSGIFINTAVLAHTSGLSSALSYTLIGILLFPLVITMSRLVALYPEGGFYTYSMEELSPFWGFFSCWSYFISKLASATLIIHIAMTLCQHVITPLASFPTLLLDIFVLALFMIFNRYNMRTGATVQAFFIIFKVIPIAFAILTGLFLCITQGVAPSEYHPWSTVGLSLPLVLYALLGFEATCSLSMHIRNAAVNGPRIIFASYGLAIMIATLYQLSFSAALGSILAHASNYTVIFPLLLQQAVPAAAHALIAPWLIPFLHLGIAASALGGSYGIIFSNAWNLYTLATRQTILGSSWIKQLNSYKIAFICICIEGLICLLYYGVTRGNQLILQQTSSLGCSIAYGLSALALYVHHRRTYKSLFVPLLGFCNSLFLISLCLYNLYHAPTKGALILFAAMITSGCTSYFLQTQKFKK